MSKRTELPGLVRGWRWCPWKDDVTEWFEDQDFGCSYCPEGVDDPHPTLLIGPIDSDERGEW